MGDAALAFKPIDYTAYIKEFMVNANKRHKERDVSGQGERHRRLNGDVYYRTALNVFGNLRGAKGSESRLKGDAVVKNLHATLDNLGYERTESQKRFHNEMIRSALPHIYGTSDFEAHKERILEHHGLPDVQYEILICTPRRWGKTTSVAMFIAALLLECEDMWIR